MAEDHWKGMESDPQSIERIRKSVELANVKEGMTVLDVGCYKQMTVAYLPACQYWGIDFQEYVPETNIQDFDGGVRTSLKFQRILCLEVLEHLKYPEKTLASIRSILEKDGVLVVSLPNECTLWHRIRALTGTFDTDCFRENCKHLHFPNLSQCRNFLSRYFEIQQEFYYIVLPLSIQKAASRLGKLSIIPQKLLSILSGFLPTLFARGFIFVLKKTA